MRKNKRINHLEEKRRKMRGKCHKCNSMPFPISFGASSIHNVYVFCWKNVPPLISSDGCDTVLWGQTSFSVEKATRIPRPSCRSPHNSYLFSFWKIFKWNSLTGWIMKWINLYKRKTSFPSSPKRLLDYIYMYYSYPNLLHTSVFSPEMNF